MSEPLTLVRDPDREQSLMGGLLEAFSQAATRDAFLDHVAGSLIDQLGGDVAGFVRQRGGRWIAESWRGAAGNTANLPGPPEDVVSEAIDRNEVVVDESWCVAPLAIAGRFFQPGRPRKGAPRDMSSREPGETPDVESEPTGNSSPGGGATAAGNNLPPATGNRVHLADDETGDATESEGWSEPENSAMESADSALELATSALVVRVPRRPGGAPPHDPRPAMGSAAAFVASAIPQIEIRNRHAKRIRELRRVLRAAAVWQRMENDADLLRSIADTACELLRCERASIFLWDRQRGRLIGRPALGVAKGSLEVDDRSGIVGEVLRAAEPRFWIAGGDDESRVNRDVDRQTDFETRSLLAVPMFAGDSAATAHAENDSGGAGRGTTATTPPRRQDVPRRPDTPRRKDAPHRHDVIGVFEALNRVDTNDGEPGFGRRHAVLLADLATHAAAAIESLRKRQSLTESRDRLVDDAARATQLIGRHRSMQAVRDTASKVAKTDLTLLVLGKNGTGKEVLARHIHFESDRRHGPFVAVNCAALVESLMESELFGHEKGAFTDAQQTHTGKFELASGGTLFLDEVGDMSPGGQAKLLRVLEEKVVVRVGGSTPIPVDVRVIAATNQPLQELVTDKRFREDLFFRLNVVSLTLPPLSERGDDVINLADHFLEQFCHQIGRRVPEWTPDAIEKLRSHRWPGNVRELRNTIERVCYLSSGDQIDVGDLMLSDPLPRVDGTPAPSVEQGAVQLNEATRRFQVGHIDRAIDACQGNMTDAAARLGLHRSNLYRKMRQLGMSTSDG